MNYAQFVSSLAVSVLFAGLTLWGALAARTNNKLLANQVEIQSTIEKAQVQQKILEQVLQRTAVLGQKDPQVLELLGKYGVTLQANPDAAKSAK